jgi:hypothetical protein
MRVRVPAFIVITFGLTLGLAYLASRSADARQNCVSPPAGMAAWYPFDGNSLDVQGGSHAALSGSPAFAAGKAGQALQFDGADDSAKVAASASSAPSARTCG